MRSTQLAILIAIYVIPAAILFGGTMAVARASRWNLLPVERAAWLLPGIAYALAPSVLNRFGVAPAPWLAFVGRLAWGRKHPRSNRMAAYATIGLSMAIAVAVALYMPPLPQ